MLRTNNNDKCKQLKLWRAFAIGWTQLFYSNSCKVAIIFMKYCFPDAKRLKSQQLKAFTTKKIFEISSTLEKNGAFYRLSDCLIIVPHPHRTTYPLW